MVKFLLAVIAVGVLAIAGVLAYDHLGIGEKEHTQAWKNAYETEKDGAELYCTLGGVVPGMQSLHDPAYKACVRDEARQRMEAWERDNPGDVWE